MKLKRIQVKTPQVGLMTNCYIVFDEKSKEAMVIDPGGEPEKIAEVLDILGADHKLAAKQIKVIFGRFYRILRLLCWLVCN